MKIIKEYLGDSVYIAHDPELKETKLYLDNGYGEHNIIFLEPDVLIALTKFIETHIK